MKMDSIGEVYVSPELEKKKEKVLRQLMAGKKNPRLWLVTLAENPPNQLEILPAIVLHQKLYEEKSITLVGITLGRQEAVEMTEKLLQETLAETKRTDIRGYLTRYK